MQVKTVESKVDEGFTKINLRLDNLITNVNEFHVSATALYATKEEIVEIKRIATTRMVQASVLAAICGSVVTLLVTYFIVNVQK